MRCWAHPLHGFTAAAAVALPGFRASTTPSHGSTASLSATPRIVSRVDTAHGGGSVRVQRRWQRSGPPNRARSSQWRERVDAHDRLQEEQRAAADADARRRARLLGNHPSTSTRLDSGGQSSTSRSGRGKRLSAKSSFDFFRGVRSREEEQAELLAKSREEKPSSGASGDASASGAAARRRRSSVREEEEQNDGDHFRYGRSINGTDGSSRLLFSFWRRLRMRGAAGVREMPLNPLHRMRKAAGAADAFKSNPNAAHVSKLLLAVEELYGKSRRADEAVTAQLSDDQKRDIVARYAETKWWGRLYSPFEAVPDAAVKRGLRIGRATLVLGLIAGIAVLLLLYREEMRAIGGLSPEDRRDYIHMVLGMRFSDIAKLADEVLVKEDPLGALSPSARCHLVVEEARRRGWHRLDWEVEGRAIHPQSAVMELDAIHMLYWSAIVLGNAVFGGGAAVFNDGIFQVEQVEKEKERREPPQQLEPIEKPATMKRTFFS